MAADTYAQKITEQEFRLGRSCPTKVLHSRSDLPRAADSFGNWMRMQSSMITSLARHLFSAALEVDAQTLTDAWLQTEALIAAGSTVAGATFVSDAGACRVDIVERDNATLRLYIFVAKIVDPDRHRFGLEFTGQSGRLRKEWRDHFELIAFRMGIVQQLYPDHRIIPFIVVPITGVHCAIEGLHEDLESSGERWQAANPHVAEEARRLLRVYGVNTECAPLIASVAGTVARLRAFLANPQPPLVGYSCKKCEFNIPGQVSGFDLCWGPKGRTTPHMFDLTYLYFVQDENGRPIADRLARDGTTSLWDIPEDLIAGDYADRQRMQLEGTATGVEILHSELGGAMKEAVYPLHFLDIETVRSLVPIHRGGKANGLTLFQLSVHSRPHHGADLIHTEWLNTETSDPNRRFLAALRATLGESGTVCVWTQFEEVSFAELLTDLISNGVDGDDFDWLRRFLGSGRLLDLHALCFQHYFSPLMKGRTSIKVVLPAIWMSDPVVKYRAPYSEFGSDPYSVLKANGVVSDGCAAMHAYLAMQAPEQRVGMAGQLRRYCGVDTLSMAYIWDYWSWRLSAGERAEKADSSTRKEGV